MPHVPKVRIINPLADLVPWWRWDHPGLVFAAVELGVLAAGTTLVALGTRRTALAPLGGVAAAGAAAVAVDVLTGARLQLNGVAGYSALSGGRYVGALTIFWEKDQ